MNMNHSGHMNHMTHMGTTEMDHSGMGHKMGSGMDPHMDGMDHMHMNTTKCGEGMMGMMMYFHTGTCEYVLFKEALVSTAGEMVGACIVIFILALIYEGLKVFREHLLRKALTPNYQSEATISKYTHTSTDTMVIDPQSAKSNGYECSGNIYHTKEIARQQIISSSHFIQTILHVVQVFISYCLMLAFMTYNVWLCLAVILGAGAGYFMFGWKRAVVVDVNEHCH
ncbi:solute carrier family 31 (copper transporter), member 1 [Mytilus galloprovincialis]|uniref:Copper transport protein n=1 Tax=Mytilus galloprovincialis TaxID=29158 RepID=A0A8B6ECP8_MYTGA|nr:solute carrier family 31 (copper transporter), member 1 [Mytilus galloprovincialis]